MVRSLCNDPNLFCKSKTHFTHIRTPQFGFFGIQSNVKKNERTNNLFLCCFINTSIDVVFFSVFWMTCSTPYYSGIECHVYKPCLIYVYVASFLNIYLYTFSNKKKTEHSFQAGVVCMVYTYSLHFPYRIEGFFLFIKNLAHGTNKTAIYFELKGNQSKGFGG